MFLANHLAKLQLECKETDYALAKAIGVHQTSVKNWKDGKNTPSIEHIARLAEHFNVQMSDFIGEAKME